MSPPAPHFIAMEARFGALNYQPLGVILSRGESVWLWDTQGNRYLDWMRRPGQSTISAEPDPFSHM